VPFEVAKLQVFGNSNIGVYIYANDKFALVPPGLTPRDIDTISKVLQVDVYETTVMGTRRRTSTPFLRCCRWTSMRLQ